MSSCCSLPPSANCRRLRRRASPSDSSADLHRQCCQICRESFPAKILIVAVAKFVQAVRGEEHGVAGMKLEGMAGRRWRRGRCRTAALLRRSAVQPDRGNEQRIRQPGVRERQLARWRVETARRASRHSGPVTGRTSMRLFRSAERRGRVCAGLVHAAQQAHHQRRVERSRQALADDVAHVDARPVRPAARRSRQSLRPRRRTARIGTRFRKKAPRACRPATATAESARLLPFRIR